MIDVSNVSLVFSNGLFGEGVPALKDFSLTINKGDFVGLLGPNGAGKSSALYTMLGLLTPDSGSVSLFGESPTPGSTQFNKLVYVPEEPNYHSYLTIDEAIRYYADLYKTPVSGDQIDQALQTMNLLDDRHRRLENCSKGMKQKLGLSTCLLTNPELLVLDEPTRGLDPLIGRRFRKELVKLNNNGTTIFLNSHVLSEVELVCDRVAIMDDGQVLEEGALNELVDINQNQYHIEMEPVEDPPGVTVEDRTDKRLIGTIQREDVSRCFEDADKRNYTIYECSLTSTSLEDAFVNIIKEEHPA